MKKNTKRLSDIDDIKQEKERIMKIVEQLTDKFEVKWGLGADVDDKAILKAFLFSVLFLLE